MKFIKNLDHPGGVQCLSGGNYAIYELNDEERKLCRDRKYMVCPKLTEFAMTQMDAIKDIIPDHVRRSECIYGYGFCDTIHECELFFIAASLQVQTNLYRFWVERLDLSEALKLSQKAVRTENANLGCSGSGYGWGVERPEDEY